MKHLKKIHSASEIVPKDYMVVYSTDEHVYCKVGQPIENWILDPSKYIENTDGTFHEYYYDENSRTIEPHPTSVELNDGEWELLESDETYNYYQSTNYSLDDTFYQFKVEWEGVENVSFKVRSNGENNYDYLCIGLLDGDKFTSSPSSDSSNVQYSTQGNASTEYSEFNVKSSTDSHHLWICYQKDSSDSENEDRGFVGVPKTLYVIIDGKIKNGNELPYEWTFYGEWINENDILYEKVFKTYTLGDGSKVKSSISKKGKQVMLEMVDLGLPSGLKWANMNIGAETETDSGLFFSWGDTTGYAIPTDKEGGFKWPTYKYCNGTKNSLTKYNTDSSYGNVDDKLVLDLEDDAAHVHMGDGWRMPTSAEMQEFIDNTTSEWFEDYNGSGVNGRLFTSKTNSNTLFVPASGEFVNYDNTSTYGEYGLYFTSSLNSSWPEYAQYMLLYDSRASVDKNGNRYIGMTIRAVHP